MENLKLIAFAVPAFLVFVFIEYRIAKAKRKEHLFHYESSISNISIGIAERMLNLFVSALFYGLFVWIYDNVRLFTIPETVVSWVTLVLATDFVWYWYHRLGHEVNLFWAAHIVHHQSEEFNLTVSARITTIQALIRTVFWCFLPLIGFPPRMVILMLLVHGAYSFFTHTQVIKRVPWLEKIFVTPSVHGVHHASNEQYLDKNYGDMFVFWDKLFGTFQEEVEQPVYGLTHPLKSRSFLWQHFHYYFEIAESFRRAPDWKGKWRAVFGSPKYMDQDIRPQLEKYFLQDRSGRYPKLRFRHYLAAQIALSMGVLTAFTYWFDSLDATIITFAVSFILLTLVNCGALLEQRKWICYLEYSRLLVAIGFGLYVMGLLEWIFVPLIMIVLAERAFNVSRRYNKLLLQETA